MTRALLVFLGILFVSTAYSEQLVVIASSSQSYPTGQLIDGQAPVSLTQGESLSLVSSAGKTILLDGPYEGQPAPADLPGESALLESLSEIVTASEQATTLAVFRNVNRKPYPWTIRAGKTGTYCLPDASSTVIKRRKPYDAIDYTVTNLNNSDSISTSWQAGEPETPWPESLELIDNAAYTIAMSGQESVEITTRLVPAETESTAHRIVWMSESGCTRQSRQLLKELVSGQQ